MITRRQQRIVCSLWKQSGHENWVADDVSSSLRLDYQLQQARCHNIFFLKKKTLLVHFRHFLSWKLIVCAYAFATLWHTRTHTDMNYTNVMFRFLTLCNMIEVGHCRCYGISGHDYIHSFMYHIPTSRFTFESIFNFMNVKCLIEFEMKQTEWKRKYIHHHKHTMYIGTVTMHSGSDTHTTFGIGCIDHWAYLMESICIQLNGIINTHR